MRKILKIVLSIALFLIVFPVVNANAATLETLQVSSIGPTPTISNIVLENGKMYMIEASGTYTFAPGDRVADAEFAYNPDTNAWHEDFGDIYEQYVLDIIVNGQPQDWLGSTDGVDFTPHTYSPDHTYRLYIEGQGQPSSIYIHDRSYDWNEGFLTVSINSILPLEKNDCKKQGWKLFSEAFKNQGSCIRGIENN